jgi:hypothetical protein
MLVLGSSILLLTGGCSQKPTTPVATPPAGVRVSPSELFSGDAKRLEPHFGLTSGCVGIESGEPVVWIGMEVELWQGGKPVKLVASGRDRVEGPTEASISIQDMNGLEGKPKHKLVLAAFGKTGSSSSQLITEKLKPEIDAPNGTMGTVAKLAGAIELVEGEHTPVWAVLAHDANNPRQFNNADKTVVGGPKQAAWALVFKVWWEKYKE